MRLYKVNPFCPECGEQHCWFRITLTEEEQQKLDAYYEERAESRKKQTEIANMIDDVFSAPLRVTRKFKCVCGHEYEATVSTHRSDEVGYYSPGMIPLGEYPLR